MHLADVAPKHFDFARGWSVLTVMAGISDMCHQCDKLPDIGKTKKALAQARRRTVSLKDPAPPSTTLAYDSPCLCQWLLRLAAERRATATMLPPEREGYELGAGLMSEAEIVFFSAHADMKSYYATGEQKRGAGSGPMSLVIGFALSAVLFVSVSWVAVKQGWIGGEEEGYGVLGA